MPLLKNERKTQLKHSDSSLLLMESNTGTQKSTILNDVMLIDFGIRKQWRL